MPILKGLVAFCRWDWLKSNKKKLIERIPTIPAKNREYKMAASKKSMCKSYQLKMKFKENQKNMSDKWKEK